MNVLFFKAPVSGLVNLAFLSPNSLGEYFDAFDQYEQLQGGYIWDWVDQGLDCVDTETGAKFWYGYQFHVDNIPGLRV